MNGNDIFNKQRRVRNSESVSSAINQRQSSELFPTESSSASSQQPIQFLNNKEIQQYLQAFSSKRHNDALLYTCLIGIQYIKFHLQGHLDHVSIQQLQSIISALEEKPKQKPGAGQGGTLSSLHHFQKSLQEKFDKMDKQNIVDSSKSANKPSSNWRKGGSGVHENFNTQQDSNAINPELNETDTEEESDIDNYELDLLKPPQRRQSIPKQPETPKETILMMKKLQKIEKSIQKQQQQSTPQPYYPPSSPHIPHMGYYQQPQYYPPPPSPNSYYSPNPHNPQGIYHHNYYQQGSQSFQNPPFYPNLPQHNPYTRMVEASDQNTPSNNTPSTSQPPQTVTQSPAVTSKGQEDQPVKQPDPSEEPVGTDKARGGMAWALSGGSPPKSTPKRPNTKATVQKQKAKSKTPAKPVKSEKPEFLKRKSVHVPTTTGMPFNPKAVTSRIKDRIMMDKAKAHAAAADEDVLILYKDPKDGQKQIATYHDDSQANITDQSVDPPLILIDHMLDDDGDIPESNDSEQSRKEQEEKERIQRQKDAEERLKIQEQERELLRIQREEERKRAVLEKEAKERARKEKEREEKEKQQQIAIQKQKELEEREREKLQKEKEERERQRIQREEKELLRKEREEKQKQLQLQKQKEREEKENLKLLALQKLQEEKERLRIHKEKEEQRKQELQRMKEEKERKRREEKERAAREEKERFQQEKEELERQRIQRETMWKIQKEKENRQIHELSQPEVSEIKNSDQLMQRRLIEAQRKLQDRREKMKLNNKERARMLSEVNSKENVTPGTPSRSAPQGVREDQQQQGVMTIAKNFLSNRYMQDFL